MTLSNSRLRSVITRWTTPPMELSLTGVSTPADSGIMSITHEMKSSRIFLQYNIFILFNTFSIIILAVIKIQVLISTFYRPSHIPPQVWHVVWILQRSESPVLRDVYSHHCARVHPPPHWNATVGGGPGTHCRTLSFRQICFHTELCPTKITPY